MVITRAMGQSLPLFALISSALLWGLSWLPLKFFHQQGINGAPLILVTYGSVALALLPWVWRERSRWLQMPKETALMVLLGGYANIAFAAALIYGDVVRTMMLFYLAPVWGVLGGRLFLGEQIDRVRALGVLFALAGAFLVLGGWTAFDNPPSPVDLLAITSGLAFALNNVLCRAAQQIPLITKGAAIFTGCALMAAAVMLLDNTQTLPAFPLTTWALLLLFGLGGLLLATLLQQWGVTHMEAGRASVILILELLIAIVSATLIGGESLSPLELAGGMLILMAAVLEASRGEHAH